MPPRVSYYYDRDLSAYSYGYGHAMKPHRIAMTHDLVSAYNMLDNMHVLRPKRATPQMMTSFHTDEYIDFLQKVTPETVEALTGRGSRYLIGDDNPCFEGLFEFCSISAGGSIAAAQQVSSGAADIAINWAGGLHHAKKGEASGFCYVNDIVLGILELLRTYPRVLYIDIDCHHGDGVEEAFYTTDRVMTCFHKFGDYFPGTGLQEDKGIGKGKGYSINVPFKDGITDEAFQSVFVPVIDSILDVFAPSAVVLQCGADSLSGDKLGCFNLTLSGHASCVQYMRQRNIPLVLLGGGGYSVKNTARAWTFETACALGIEGENGIRIGGDLPYCESFEWFGPRYKLEVVASSMEDCNVRDGVLDIVRTIALQQLSELRSRGAPSVGMQDVPRESLGDHLAVGTVEVTHSPDSDDEEMSDGRDKEKGNWDELDETLAKHTRYIHALQRAKHPVISASSEDEVEEDSDYETHRHRPIMSIVTNQFMDLPAHAKPKRRFFAKGRRDRMDEDSDEITI